MEELARRYNVTEAPLISLGPMRLIATAPLTAAVSNAGGLGFLGAGSDLSTLSNMITQLDELLNTSCSINDRPAPVARYGIGILCWGADLQTLVKTLEKAPILPCAIWLYAPYAIKDLKKWSEAIHNTTKGSTDIWVQIGSVAEARDAFKHVNPQVLICQGVDAGGHGLTHGCSFVSLLPEVSDVLDDAVQSGELISRPYLVAAGGIADGRGAAAAVACGAEGITIGTRFLASKEANIAQGYKREVVRAVDGGQTTIRTNVYDMLRGTTDWPERYGGRGVINASYEDWCKGMDNHENKSLYEKSQNEDGDEGWGPNGRMTTYAGTAIGLIRDVKSAGDIVGEVIRECREKLQQVASLLKI